MLALVSDVEKEEQARQALLEECANEDEQLKLRQKFIVQKAEGQKKVKKLLERHRKEADYIDKEEINYKLKQAKALKGEKEDAGEEEGGNEEHEGEEEMAEA